MRNETFLNLSFPRRILLNTRNNLTNGRFYPPIKKRVSFHPSKGILPKSNTGKRMPEYHMLNIIYFAQLVNFEKVN